MGSGLYGASKAIAISDLITTVTPEKRMEESSEVQGKKRCLWLILNQILNLSNYLRPFFSFFSYVTLVEEVQEVENVNEKEQEEEETKETEISQQSTLTPPKIDTKVIVSPVNPI